MIYIPSPCVLSLVSSASVFFLDSQSYTLHHPSKHFPTLFHLLDLYDVHLLCAHQAMLLFHSPLPCFSSKSIDILHQAILIIFSLMYILARQPCSLSLVCHVFIFKHIPIDFFLRKYALSGIQQFCSVNMLMLICLVLDWLQNYSYEIITQGKP